MSSTQTRTPRSYQQYDSQQSLSQNHLDRSSIHTVTLGTGTGTNSTGSNRILDAQQQQISGKNQIARPGLHQGLQSKPGDRIGLRQQLQDQHQPGPSGISSSSRLDQDNFKGQTQYGPHQHFQYYNQTYYNRNKQRLQYYDPSRYRSSETQNPVPGSTVSESLDVGSNKQKATNNHTYQNNNFGFPGPLGSHGILKQSHLQYQSQSPNLWYLWGKNIKVKSIPRPLKEISPYKFQSFAEFLLYCTYDDLKYYKPQSYQDFYDYNQYCAYKHQERSKALNCPDTYIQDLEFGLQLPLPGQRHPAEIDVQPAPVEPLEVVARKYRYPNIIVMSKGISNNDNQDKESEQQTVRSGFSRDRYQQQTQQDDDLHARMNDSSVTNDSSSQFQEQFEDLNHVSDDDQYGTILNSNTKSLDAATENTIQRQASKSTDRIYIKFAERWSHLTMYQKHRIGVCEPCYFILKPIGCGREKKHKCAIENLKKMQQLYQGQGVCKEATVTNVISSTGNTDIKGHSTLSGSEVSSSNSNFQIQSQSSNNDVDIPPPCDFCHYCSLRRAFLVDKWRKKKNAFNPRPHGFWDYNQNPCQEAIMMLYEPHLSRIGINVEEVMDRIWKRDESSDGNSKSLARRGIEKMEEGLKPWWNPNPNRNKDKM